MEQFLYWSVHWASIFKLVLNTNHIKIWFRNGKYVIQQVMIIWFCCSSVTKKCKMNVTLKFHASKILLPQKLGTFCVFTFSLFSAFFKYCRRKNRLTCVSAIVFISVRSQNGFGVVQKYRLYSYHREICIMLKAK